MENHQPQDMGCVQNFYPPILSITEESGHHRRKGRIHSDGTKFLWCNATFTRQAPQGDRQLEHYCSGNADIELQCGITGKIQFLLPKFKLSGNGTIITDECDNEFHASAYQYFFIGYNKINKYGEKVLLLKLG